jgi:predicted short-subunit dehydrogenase-like oxidoreductase (DUF2520 family)
MKIGFIGAGKVGSAFGHYLLDKGLEVLGYSSNSLETAISAAQFTNTKYYELIDLVNNCEYIFITTPDDIISEVWNKLKSFNLQDKKIFHMSGYQSSAIFDGIEDCGALGYSLHPFFSFTNRNLYKNLENAIFTIQGKKIAQIEGFLSISKIKYFEIKEECKTTYHAAAVFASNYLVCLSKISKELLLECGIPEEEATQALYPLMSSAVDNIKDKGVEGALTGPIIRGDTKTVIGHRKALNNYREIYDELGKVALKIAAENGNLSISKIDALKEILGGKKYEKNDNNF